MKMGRIWPVASLVGCLMMGAGFLSCKTTDRGEASELNGVTSNLFSETCADLLKEPPGKSAIADELRYGLKLLQVSSCDQAFSQVVKVTALFNRRRA